MIIEINVLWNSNLSILFILAQDIAWLKTVTATFKRLLYENMFWGRIYQRPSHQLNGGARLVETFCA